MSPSRRGWTARSFLGRAAIVPLLTALGCTSPPTESLEIDVIEQLRDRSVVAGFLDLGHHERGDSPIGDGWHMVEPTGRWTAKRDAQLLLPLAHVGPGHVEIVAAAYGYPGPSKQLTLAVNGFVLPAVSVTNTLEVLKIAVPDGVFRLGDNRVVIACDAIHHVDPRVDRRAFGVFVDRIRLVPEAAPDPVSPRSDPLVLSSVEWIEDPRGALASSDLTLRWRSPAPGFSQETEVRIVLVELDEQGRVTRELDAANVAGDSGSVRLRPPRDVDTATACRLELRSEDPQHSVEIIGASRWVAARDDVLLIVIDTLRADALASYGNGTAHTPHLDRLAAEGTLFRTAIAHAPVTGPSHASILQSLVPSRAGIVNNHVGRLDPNESTLAELLAAHGYACRSAVSISPIFGRFGFSRGFDEVDEQLGVAFLRDGEITTALAERWLSAAGSARPRFDFVHLAEPHEPYDAHGSVEVEARIFVGETPLARIPIADFRPSVLEFDVAAGPHSLRIETDRVLQVRRFELFDTHATGSWLDAPPPAVIRERWTGTLHVQRAGRLRLAQALNDGVTSEAEIHRRYALEVEAVDRFVGRILDALERSGRAERTWVIFTADHGEELGDRGTYGHVHTLFDEVVRVPLIVRPPSRERSWRGKVREDLAAGVDIMPTILDVLGIDAPAGRHGRSLRTPSPSDRAVWIETHAPQAERTLFALRSLRHKVIWAADEDQWKVFDLVEDPSELEDLHPTRPAIAQPLREQLRAAHREYVTEDQGTPVVLDAESEAALRSLGYIE